MLPYKTKQFFFALLKISIVAGAFYFIYQKLTKNPELDFNVFAAFLEKNHFFSIKSLFIILLISLLNWLFEILKWKVLVSEIKSISIKTAIEQSLGALTASLFTPNRIGEYGAKAMYFNKRHRKRIMLISLMGNVMQMGITCILGVIGLMFFTSSYALNLDYPKLSMVALISITILLLLVFILNKSKMVYRGFSFEKVRNFVSNFSRKKIGLSLLYSFFRYMLFSFQFYFLLLLFNVDISYLNAMIVISSMYLLVSLIPSIFIFDVLVKGSVALYLFAFIGVDELTILSIVTLMWLFNFVVPSIVGSYYVLKFKMTVESSYQSCY